MCALSRCCVCVVLLCCVLDSVLSRHQDDSLRTDESHGSHTPLRRSRGSRGLRTSRRHHQRRNFRKYWAEDWEAGDPVPDYNRYQADSVMAATDTPLWPRMEIVSNPKVDTRGVLHSEQRGSAIIPYHGATVHVSPSRTSSGKLYRGTITSTITDGPRTKKNRKQRVNKNRQRKDGRSPEYWVLSQDQPKKRKVCARCPSDRAVLAKKGSNTVLMEPPPVIPCHPWSSVEKVKAEVVVGPKPGEEIPEGSHKIAIQLRRRRRVLTTCVTRYNVIVRKCPDLELGLGVHSSCPLGKTWGAHCNFTCDPGYDLEGDSQTHCTDELEWSGVMPTCNPTTACPKPVTPQSGHLSCRTPHHQPIKPLDMLPDGSVCHFLCDPGFVIPPAQQHLSRTRCIGGSWDNHQDPVCVETNDLDEEEKEDTDNLPQIPLEDSFRFDGKGCPENFCNQRGRCILILEEPMCSCQPGYSGPRCEEEEENLDPDPDEANTIT